MKNAYKSIRNRSIGTMVAAGENVKSHGKYSTTKLAKKLASASLALGASVAILSAGDAAADDSVQAVGYSEIAPDAGTSAETASDAVLTQQALDDSTSGTNGVSGKKLFGAQMLGAAPTGVSVLYDDSTNNSISFVGTAGTKLSNVAAGAISAGSMDAVNGSQLFGITSGSAVVNSAYMKVNGSNNGSDNASVTSFGGIAIGAGASANTPAYDGSIAIGRGATVPSSTGYYGGMAIGAGSYAIGTAIGYSASASGAKTVALGRDANAGVFYSTALGAESSASASYSVALGFQAVADRVHTISVGAAGSERQVVNLAAGTQGTDAVNYAQLQAAGLTVNTKGQAINSFVAYDNMSKDTLTLAGGSSGTRITNVAAGDVSSAASMDAVNGSQLYTTNQNIATSAADIAASEVDIAANASGISAANAAIAQIATDATTNTSDIAKNAANISANTSDIASSKLDITRNAGDISTLNTQMADAVKYDTSGHSAITLGGGASGTAITNLRDGQVNASSKDAVNGSQLFKVQQSIATQGGAGADSVQYDSAAHDKITFGAAGTPVTLSNVKDGDVSASSLDAVNGSQLYSVRQDVIKNASDIASLNSSMSDLSTGASGVVRQDALANAISIGASSNGNSVSFAGLQGSRVLTGVANGAVDQGSSDAINGAQMFNASSKMASALGGGAGVDNNGGVTAPSYAVGGKQVHDVGSAIGNLDGRVTQNSADIAGMKGDFANVANAAANAVAYDSADHGKITLGDADTAAAVQLTNVAAGDVSATSTDAVNGAQLSTTNNRVTSAENAIANLQASGMTGSAASGQDAAAIGANAEASGDNATAAGAHATASGSGSTATGGSATASGNNSTANGSNSIASGESAVAFGGNASATGSNAAAIGGHSQASGNNAVAFGGNSQASGDNSVALGANSVANEADTVSVGSAGNERRVTNVAPGVNGTDAANVNQVNALRNDMGASFRSLQRSAYGGIAAAMAMPNSTPSAPGKTVVGAGVANFKGYTALGAGVTYRSDSGRWIMNGAVSVAPSGDTGVRAHADYEF